MIQEKLFRCQMMKAGDIKKTLWRAESRGLRDISGWMENAGGRREGGRDV